MRVQPRFVQNLALHLLHLLEAAQAVVVGRRTMACAPILLSMALSCATRGCRRGDSTWVLPHVETFGLSFLTLLVNGDLAIAAWDRETQREEEEKPQAQQECFRDTVKAQIPPASPRVCPASVPSSVDKTRLQQ